MQIKKPPVWSTYGGLGPDRDSDKVLYGRAVQCKVADFSNQLRDFNRKKVYRSVMKDNSDDDVRQLTARERAIEYARSIPRVKVHKRRTLVISPHQESTPQSIGDRLLTLLKEHHSTDRIIKQLRMKYSSTS